MSELDPCSNTCFVRDVLVFKNSLTEWSFKMFFNLKTQCSWNMMIGQKLTNIWSPTVIALKRIVGVFIGVLSLAVVL